MADTATRPRGRPRGFDRDKALAGALGLFVNRGYEGTTIAELTAATGLPVKSLYNTFSSKEALFEEAVALYQRTEGCFASAALERETTALEAVAALLREAAAHYAPGAYPGGCMVALGVLRCGGGHEPVAARMARRRGEARAEIRARLARGVVEGDLRSDTPLDALAGFYAATLQGMSVQARDGASAEDLAAIAELALAPLRASIADDAR